MDKLAAVLFCICGIPGVIAAQDFSFRKTEIKEGKIILHYNLADSVSFRTYTISVYSSKDNFIAPLEKITGDAGLEVKPGGNKQITWDPVAEYGPAFSGKVALEVRGHLYIPFIRLDGFDDYKVIKRKKSYELTWHGGTPQNIINFELYKDDKKITAFPNIANVGHYTMEIPMSVKPGKNYRFKITDSKNKDEIVYTNPFTIKRKVPLLVKIIPVAGVAAAVYFLSSKSSEEDPDIVGPPAVPE